MSLQTPISVSGLNHSFGKGDLRKQILFDVSTEIQAGEIVIVTGPSGSGKTTMLTLVGALRSAQEGSVRILGEELHKARPRTLEKVRKQIGFIFQQHNLLGALSAIQNVELGIRASGKYKGGKLVERAREMLVAVGLEDRIHHKPEQLSGGQRQRVAIARALAAEPVMLLADEPTASLDKKSGREVVDRMKSLANEKGTTILLVTHDNRILDIADRIIHLEDGRLSTFTDAVIANNRHMMEMLADNRQKQTMHEVVEDMDEAQFKELLLEITDERSSLFLVKHEHGHLELKVAENLDDLGSIRIPIGKGIAGAVAQTGQAIRIDDAYADSRFNPEVDRQTGYRTRSIISLPIMNQAGEVFAVAQLLNRKDGQPFGAGDEQKFTQFIESIGIIFETLEGLSPHIARRRTAI